MGKQIWTSEDIQALYDLPLFQLIDQARDIHLKYFHDDDIEFCTLCSIKTGACPEDCAYCPQSGHYDTDLQKQKLMSVELVVAAAEQAKANGAKRFCMGAAWRSPPKKDFPMVVAMVKAVKALDLETCMTLGMLEAEQAAQLKQAGLDYYNHNLDTSPEYYPEIIQTRTYQQRLDTLALIAAADIKVCCGGIIGMGETRHDRIGFLLALKNLAKDPESIPINQLIPIPGTPLADKKAVDSFEFIRTIAIARLMFPKSRVRLSAGRENMSAEMQAWCFMAGANSIFIGDELLTAQNVSLLSDQELFDQLGLTAPNHSETMYA